LNFGLRYLEPVSFLSHYDTILRASKKRRLSLIYLPLQSGSQRLLRLMNRPQDIQKLRDGITKIRSCSGTVFYTNWMVGFPTETPEDFDETVSLAKHLRLDVNVVIPYSPRPGTAALLLKPEVPVDVKKQRTERFKREMAELKAEMLLGGRTVIPASLRDTLFSRIVSVEVVGNDDLYD